MPSEMDTSRAVDSVNELVDELVARAEAHDDGCVALSELSELVQQVDLSDEEAQLVHDLVQERGLDVRELGVKRHAFGCIRAHLSAVAACWDWHALAAQLRRYPRLSA